MRQAHDSAAQQGAHHIMFVAMALAAAVTTSPFDEWRNCLREYRGQYEAMSEAGTPQLPLEEYVHGYCAGKEWRARIALEPDAERAFLKEGIRRPSIDVITVLIDKVVERETVRLLGVKPSER